MITNELKDFLAIVNELTPERYIDKVNENGRSAFTSEEEHARHRKVEYMILKYLTKDHPEIVDEPAYKEAVEYYESFESIKKLAKEDLNINTKGD